MSCQLLSLPFSYTFEGETVNLLIIQNISVPNATSTVLVLF